MKLTPALSGLAILFYTLSAAGQQAPIYTVTVVERTVSAINYQYRSGPTKINFHGTVLLPAAKGEAVVEGQRGRTEIDAKFENITPPTRYGPEYLTYTLWAITPEGAPHNLGELVADGSNKAKLHVTTGLQVFGLIVTAEPYSTTRQPSDVVVLENEVRPDTLGTVKPIQAKYELMPRGHYTWEVPDRLGPAMARPKLSMDKYEALLELYEAQNAVGVARAAGAARYASSTLQEAQALLDEAQRLQDKRASSGVIVQNAREAAQTAEDARTIADRRRQEERIASAEQEAARAHEAQAEAVNGARQARIERDAVRAQAEQERTARERAEAEAAEQRNRADRAEAVAAHAVAPPPPPTPAGRQAALQTELRMRLFEQFNVVLLTRDTPRGLVATLADSAFNGSALREPEVSQVARLAAIVKQYPALRIDVEGFMDEAAATSSSWTRAESVRRILLEEGLPADRVSARGLGDSRALMSNSSAAGRTQNRRVEIVISGEPIGNLPFWDRTYSLVPSGARPN